MKFGVEGVTIRRMTTADLDHVLAIAQSFPQAPQWPRPAYLTALNPESAPRRIALAAAGPGSLFGFAVARLLPPQAELETIAVAPDSQRRGLGQFIFRALVTELKAAGVGELLLEVRVSNGAALDFYQAVGFIQTGLRPGYYADPKEDAVLMRFALT